jgi:hypothetical protein
VDAFERWQPLFTEQLTPPPPPPKKKLVSHASSFDSDLRGKSF